MKKMVIFILAVLPIFLLLTISFLGKTMSPYVYIPVEKVMFVDDEEEELDSSYFVLIDKDETYQLNVKVYPTLATDKSVIFKSTNEKVCTVDTDGLVTGNGFGNANVNVYSVDDNTKIDTITISVTDNNVSGVKLSVNELELAVGEMRKISAIIEPVSALNKKISWATNDSSVCKVDQNGYITAVGEGVAEVFVITDDGKFTDVCIVTCINGTPSLSLDFSLIEGVTKLGEGYQSTVNEIDLKEIIVYNSDLVSFDDIKISIVAGSGYVTLDENMILTFISTNKVINISIYVGDINEPDYIYKTIIIYK